MISSTERQAMLQHRHTFSDWIFDGPKIGELYVKALVNYLQKTTPSNVRLLHHIEDGSLSEREMMKMQLADILEYIVLASGDEHGKTYTTGQLAEIFGVSITTINNWINGGRFIGV